ncbi:glycogen synthase [Cystoisospora suis]|uniref:Glycogen synthase n=1 Tax=Cystoisospora suis TaxID=483139 RepID=A0A2C6JZL6_9APIC|nr:glycogen synthase [Cystoisospora suis]
MANWKDGYASRCASQMLDLRARFPHSFWAEPSEFFSNGTLVNLGADFGLMPSLFEPGGIVQHEFFIAGTPVIAFRTGGLKDTVHEGGVCTPGGGVTTGAGVGGVYSSSSSSSSSSGRSTSVSVEAARKNNGFTFGDYTAGDFLFAIERALRVFGDRSKYEQLRLNARASVVSCEESARAWLGEFARLRKKIPVNEKRVDEIFRSLPPWSEAEWRRQRLSESSKFTEKERHLSSSSSSFPLHHPLNLLEMLHRNEVRRRYHPSHLEEDTWGVHTLKKGGGGGRRGKGTRRGASSVTQGDPSQSDYFLDREEEEDGAEEEEDENERYLSEEQHSNSRTAPGAGGGGKGRSLRDGGGAGRSQKEEEEEDSRAIGVPCRITYVPLIGKPRPRSVAVAGTFDDWRVRRPLAWNNALQAFATSLALRPGR